MAQTTTKPSVRKNPGAVPKGGLAPKAPKADPRREAMLAGRKAAQGKPQGRPAAKLVRPDAKALAARVAKGIKLSGPSDAARNFELEVAAYAENLIISRGRWQAAWAEATK